MRIGKIIIAQNPLHEETAEGVCVAEATGYLWLVPTSGDLSSQEFKFLRLGGIGGWEVVSEFEDKELVNRTMQRLDEYVELADDMIITPSQAAQAQDNLHALRAALSFEAAFGENSRIGKIAFVEFPLGSTQPSGDYIIIAESNNSLYGVCTQHSLAGCCAVRIVLDRDDGGEVAKIISLRENDNYIDETVEHLTNFVYDKPVDQPHIVYESASTVLWQIKHAMEFKANRCTGPFCMCAKPVAPGKMDPIADDEFDDDFFADEDEWEDDDDEWSDWDDDDTELEDEDDEDQDERDMLAAINTALFPRNRGVVSFV